MQSTFNNHYIIRINFKRNIMTQLTNLNTAPLHTGSLTKRILQGAGIALILISAFLFPFDGAKPEWGNFWMIKPLVIVPLAGASGGVFYYWMDYLRIQGSWKKILANVLSLIGFLFVLWIGTVLGLNGTLWD